MPRAGLLRTWEELVKALLGYCAHMASVRLHEVAVGWTGGILSRPPVVYAWRDDGRYYDPLTLPDVAPRLAAAIDWGRDKARHVAWLAGGGGMGK